MNTQVIFKIDKKIKEKLKKKCVEEGMTISGFYRAVTKALANGDIDFSVDLVIKPSITKKILNKYL